MKLGRSSADDTWTPAENGRLVITGGTGSGGIIFGVPWLGFGLYFLYKYLILGFVEYIRAGDIMGLFTGAFGWLIILLFGSIFVVPGWLLVFMRRKVVVDTVYGKVEEMKDFLLFKRVKVHRLADFGSIRVVATNRKSGHLQEVRLMPRGQGDHVQAAIMFDDEEARRLGQALATLLHLPCTTEKEAEGDEEEQEKEKQEAN